MRAREERATQAKLLPGCEWTCLQGLFIRLGKRLTKPKCAMARNSTTKRFLIKKNSP
jgi:hypothetical protein